MSFLYRIPRHNYNDKQREDSKMVHRLSRPDEWLGLYGDILYRYGYARLRDRDAAEDLVQETLIAALKAKENFAGQASERTWLIGILKHKIIDYFRKTAKEPNQEYDDGLAGVAEEEFFDERGNWQHDVSSWSKPDKSLEQTQFFEVLQRCIDRLPPRLAQLFVLREIDGIDTEEICGAMTITPNNFWVMMSRARVQLRHCLDLNWFNT